jgi:putative DNA primase/helicase
MSTRRNPIEEVVSWVPASTAAKVAEPVNGTGFNLESFIARNLAVRRGPLAWDGRGRKWELEICPFNAEHTGGCAVVTERSNGQFGFKCQHNGCRDKHWRDVRELFDGPRPEGQHPGPPNLVGPAQVLDWAEPIPFRSRKTPTIPADLLPGFLGDMASATARATETPLELAALLGLAVVAASVAKKVTVSPEPGYIEPVNIYTIVPLESGNRKTAVLHRMTRPFMDWEVSEARRLKPEISRIASERKTQEARIESLRKKAAKSSSHTELMAQVAEMELLLQEIPKAPRLWTQDVTPERLGPLMADQGERIALLSDEGGIFDVLAGRYSKGTPNLDLFLQAHAGSQVRVDRGSRPPVMLRNPALTVALSPQPDVLESLSDKPGFRGRGLLARFLYGLPASPIGFRELNPTPCPSAVEKAYCQGIERLLRLAPPIDEAGDWLPWQLRFSPPAYEAWKDFQRSIEILMRDGGKLCQLKDWGSKLPGAAARVACVLHCVVVDPSESTVISVDTVDRVLNLVTPLIDHALAAFNLMERDKTSEDAQKILAWIRKQ